MALKLIINISKKVPGPLDFSSTSASCSLEGELAAGQDPAAETARLFAQAETAVDQQLARGQAQPAPVAPPVPAASSNPPQVPAQRPAASQPYRATNQPRRGPAPVTDSQLRFLDRLIQQTNSSVPAILQQHQVGALRDLSCKAAAGLIDELKGLAVPA